MEDPQLMGVLVERLDALVGESVVRDVELVEVEVAAVEHLFQPIVSDVVINDVERFEPLGKVLRYIEQAFIGDFAAVEFQVLQVGVAFEELVEQAFIEFGEVVLEYLGNLKGTCMLVLARSISSCSWLSWWLLMSRVTGCGTSSRIRGNSFSSISLRSKHRDLPLEPIMPFLMSISYFILRSFSRAIIFSLSSRSFFCSHACSS